MDIWRWTVGGGPLGAGTDWATKKVFGDAAGGIMNTAAPWNLTNPNAYKEGHRATAHVLGNLGLGGGGGGAAPAGGGTPFRANPQAVQQQSLLARQQQAAGDASMRSVLGSEAPTNPSIAALVNSPQMPPMPSPMMAGPGPSQMPLGQPQQMGAMPGGMSPELLRMLMMSGAY